MTAQQKREMELSGIIGPGGRLDRPIKPGMLRVPKRVELLNNQLHYNDTDYRLVPTSPVLLQSFIALKEADNNSILRFAKRWGVLRICRHGLPDSHLPYGQMNDQVMGHAFKFCSPQDTDLVEGCWYCERISEWRTWAAEIEAVLNIAANLNNGKVGSDQDWAQLSKWIEEGVWDLLYEPLEPLESQFRLFIWVLRGWIEVANLHPSLTRKDGKWSLSFFTGGLFQGLTLRLILAVTTTDSLAVCSACGVSYFPERRPDSQRRNYCQLCRRSGVPIRDAQRASRERKRKERKK